MNEQFENQETVDQILTTPPKNKKHKKGDFLKLTAYTAVFGIMSGVSFYGISQVTSNHSAIPSVVQESTKLGDSTSEKNSLIKTSVATGSAISSTSGSGVSSVAEAVLPSIVQIQVTSSQEVSDAFGRSYQQEGTGSGSGIIIGETSTEILIVTNNHVVDGSTKVTIQFADDQKVAATVKGTDSNADLAVVSVKKNTIKATTLAKIKVAKLGDSTKVKVGERAIAIGNAMGYGTSVTVGYISAKDRKVTFEDGSMTLLQTDAAINPGNSGGALVNDQGQVIGINSAKFASEEIEGMGFAIPISTAVPIINELMNKEAIPESEQAYLGIKGQDVTAQYTSYYGIPTGVYISEVTKGSPAANAGLTQGQVITKVNKTTVKTTEELQKALAQCRAGDKGTITVQVNTSNNKYESREISVTFGSKTS